jgi:hypothetical protein
VGALADIVPWRRRRSLPRATPVRPRDLRRPRQLRAVLRRRVGAVVRTAAATTERAWELRLPRE